STEPSARTCVLEQHDCDLSGHVGDLGGHDLADILDALALAREERDRPTVVFAYTVKGYALEIAGRPQNHSALLTPEQVDRFRQESGLTLETEWDAFDPDTDEGRLLAAAAARLRRDDRPPAPRVSIPAQLSDRAG